MDVSVLWENYTLNPSVNNLNILIESYLPLLKSTVNVMLRHIPPFIQREDLEQYGFFGLLDAIKKYDFAKGVKFESYAIKKIRWAIQDGLREHDSMSRMIRRHKNFLSHASDNLRQKMGCEPGEIELCDVMKISPVKLRRMQRNISSATHVPLTQSGFESIGDDEERESVTDLNDFVEMAKGKLTRREREVVDLYYHEGRTLLETGKIMKLSESRISQIHSGIMTKLRSYFLLEVA